MASERWLCINGHSCLLCECGEFERAFRAALVSAEQIGAQYGELVARVITPPRRRYPDADQIGAE